MCLASSHRPAAFSRESSNRLDHRSPALLALLSPVRHRENFARRSATSLSAASSRDSPGGRGGSESMGLEKRRAVFLARQRETTRLSLRHDTDDLQCVLSIVDLLMVTITKVKLMVYHVTRRIPRGTSGRRRRISQRARALAPSGRSGRFEVRQQ